MTELNLIATAAFGLEAVVVRELKALGYHAKADTPGRVWFRGDASAMVRSNLWLRTADRVLIEIGRFQAQDFGELFDHTRALPWEQWMAADAAFPVSGKSIKSQLSSVPACQKIVKKAVVEKLLAAHRVNELPEVGPKYQVEVALLNDQAVLTLDTTGPSLHKRGYRKLTGRAPLRETLAAAMVMLSFWKPGRPLIDPFCGTGTIAIEAAMIGRNIAPGLRRDFAAQTWPHFPTELWQQHRDHAQQQIAGTLEPRIVATDTDEDALSMARYHAKVAGVEDDIHFQQQDFLELTSKRQHGVLIANPPYGERLDELDDVRTLYQRMPEIFRHLPTWSFYVLTSLADFEQVVGQQANRRRKLYNGRIACTYFQYHGPTPGSTPATGAGSETAVEAPAFGGVTSQATERQRLEFRNRLTRLARHLRKWPRRGITCYRIYDRDIPEIPLCIDVYDGRLHIAEYERPHERTPAEHLDWIEVMLATAGEVLGVDRTNIFLKQRGRKRGLTQYERVSGEGRTAVVEEAGLKFRINLSDYIDTGLFLDHRNTRAMVRQNACGKRVLNLFCYTGAFTVYAAAGGASHTTSVDLSNTYLDWAADNMKLNGYDIDGKTHRLVREDAMVFCRGYDGDPFEIAVIDPPTFSNSKMADDDFDVQRHHVELLKGVLSILAPDGMIYFSTNFRRFKIDQAGLGGAVLSEISQQTVPDDFRNKRIHRCWRIGKQ